MTVERPNKVGKRQSSHVGLVLDQGIPASNLTLQLTKLEHARHHDPLHSSEQAAGDNADEVKAKISNYSYREDKNGAERPDKYGENGVEEDPAKIACILQRIQAFERRDILRIQRPLAHVHDVRYQRT